MLLDFSLFILTWQLCWILDNLWLRLYAGSLRLYASSVTLEKTKFCCEYNLRNPDRAVGWLYIVLGKVPEIAMLMKSRFRPGFVCFLGKGEPWNFKAEIPDCVWRICAV